MYFCNYERRVLCNPLELTAIRFRGKVGGVTSAELSFTCMSAGQRFHHIMYSGARQGDNNRPNRFLTRRFLPNHTTIAISMQKQKGRSPSGHLSRLKPVELDPLAEYGLPSKGEKRCAASHPTLP